MGLVNQIKYLLKKNYVIKRRNKKETLQEVLIPIWWTLLLFFIRRSFKTPEMPAVSDSQIPVVDIFSPLPTGFGSQGNESKSAVGYVTNGLPNARLVIELLRNSSQSAVRYKKFNNSDDMLHYYRKHGETSGLTMGIEFTRGKNEGLAYTLLLSRTKFPKLEDKLVGQAKCHDMTKAFILNDCEANSYIFEQEAALQARIDAAITKIETNLSHYVVPNIQAQMMPKDSFTPSVQAFSLTAALYLVLAFAPYVTVLSVSLVQEKEQKQKELMRIMGVSDIAYWLSWFLTYAIILFFSVIVLNAILVPGKLFGESNYVVMVIIFYLFGLSIIMIAFLLTPFFKSAKTAGTFASLFTIILGCAAVPLIILDVADPGRWALSLLSPTAFAVLVSKVYKARE